MRLILGELSMKIRPLHDRVIIKRIEAEAKSAGGTTTSRCTTAAHGTSRYQIAGQGTA